MSIWQRFTDWLWDRDYMDSADDGFDDTDHGVGPLDGHDEACSINPATGLPMVGGCGGVDVAGNPYGMDMDDTWSGSQDIWTGTDDSWSGSQDTWTGTDDSWSGSHDTWTSMDDTWSSSGGFND